MRGRIWNAPSEMGYCREEIARVAGLTESFRISKQAARLGQIVPGLSVTFEIRRVQPFGNQNTAEASQSAREG